MHTIRFDSVEFLDVEDVVAFHEDALGHGGGAAGVRDPGLLESAVMAPRSGFYGSLAEMAAVYAHGIAKNHAFVDGNKRTALLAALAFLEMNGFPLTLASSWADRMEHVADGEVSRDELAEAFAIEMGGDVAIE